MVRLREPKEADFLTGRDFGRGRKQTAPAEASALRLNPKKSWVQVIDILLECEIIFTSRADNGN
jgi:hypothetical protein